MTAPMPDPYRPGAALPHPLDADGPTRWGAPAADYATDPAASSGWMDADPPAVGLPVVEPVTLRVWAPSAAGNGESDA